ncbi:divalent-cation tolerance protein CutA [Tropicimonas isoalkanivorans]|uniref:Divalent cation tolerance protein n=1 Tax=Tropicimonas isoalkanivorans TaxID=441112 RepID=A0A1I1PGK6_9RHOB|nr:divalent-cation tolerance protein CutA [Tropicimonas isoalkanivorans]SFD08961.1 divalent cation tolerance protein [Tropicimonas isoalkanivorans]
MPFLAFLVNCPDAAIADKIADTLIARRLVAVATRNPPTQSTFHWKGEVKHAQQHPLVLKTRPELRDLVEAEIARMHPYEVPPITRVTMEGSVEYLSWIANETSGGEQ